MRGSDQAQFIAGPETTACGANQGSSGKKKEGMAVRPALSVYDPRAAIILPRIVCLGRLKERTHFEYTIRCQCSLHRAFAAILVYLKGI